MKDRFVLAYHGETKSSYLDELDLVYRNFLLLDKSEKTLVVEGELEKLEEFLVRNNLKSWVVIQAQHTSPLLWSQSFPKKEVQSCSECSATLQPLWFDDERSLCYICQPMDYKYDVAYPDANAGDSPEVDIRKSDVSDNCAECSADTFWITTQFGVGVPTCSKDCTDSMWKGYINS